MKKILGLAIAALIIMSTVGFGTWAYFSDTETSTDNQITAGTLALSVNSGYSDVTIMTGLTNKAPGDTGAAYATLKNEGSLPGYFGIQTSSVTNSNDPATPLKYRDGTGDLGGVATIVPWLDMDKSGAWSDGDIALKNDGTTVTRVGGTPASLSGLYGTFNSYASKTYASIIASMSSGSDFRFYLSWSIPTSAGNSIQGDSVKISLTFTIDQIH